MQLKKEVRELTLQRDLAQSRISDMLRVHGEDVATIELVSIFARLKALKVVTDMPFLFYKKTSNQFSCLISSKVWILNIQIYT